MQWQETYTCFFLSGGSCIYPLSTSAILVFPILFLAVLVYLLNNNSYCCPLRCS